MVFKVQANMDPAHRDRVAFVRVSSSRFERGMRLKVARTGKEMRPNNVVSFLSQRRELLDEAYAGDVIGIPNHGVLQLGDVLTEGESLRFTGLPFFAPELFQAVEVKDPLRTKQLRVGLTQLGRGRHPGVPPGPPRRLLLLGAVKQLQFEVVAHRLKTEYGVDARMMPSRYTSALDHLRRPRARCASSWMPMQPISPMMWSMRRRSLSLRPRNCAWPKTCIRM